MKHRLLPSQISDFSLLNQIVFAIIILCFCSLSLISYVSSSNALLHSIVQSLQSRAADNAYLVEREINAVKRSIEGVANLEVIKTMDWTLQKNTLISEGLRLGVIRFQVANLSGYAYSTLANPFSISDRPHFKAALLGATTISNPIVSKVENKVIIACAAPIYGKEGSTVGVLTAAYDHEFFYRLMGDIKIRDTGYAFIIDNEGTFIAHPQQELVTNMQNFIKLAREDPSYKRISLIEERMISRESGFGYYNYMGVEKLCAFAPIPNSNLSIALSVPKNEIFKEIIALRQIYIMMTLISVIFLISLSLLVLKYISEHKKMDRLRENVEKNEKLLKESKELDKLKTEFFANISHELRTPLNVILATIQLFNLYDSDNKTLDVGFIRKHIKVMKQNCRRLLRLVNNLIDTTKIEANYYHLHLSNCNIVPVIEDITMSVTNYIREKHIHITFDTDVEEKLIAVDIDAVERVMLNLLSNAVKFTREEGNISVKIYDLEDSIIISVKDTGIGIESDKQELIFERFRQVDKSLTRSHEGSGIGLSLVKSIIEMHGGKISVSSEYGNGSEFIIELPVKILTQNNIVNEHVPHNREFNKNLERIHVEFSDIYF